MIVEKGKRQDQMQTLAWLCFPEKPGPFARSDLLRPTRDVACWFSPKLTTASTFMTRELCSGTWINPEPTPSAQGAPLASAVRLSTFSGKSREWLTTAILSLLGLPGKTRPRFSSILRKHRPRVVESWRCASESGDPTASTPSDNDNKCGDCVFSSFGLSRPHIDHFGRSDS